MTVLLINNKEIVIDDVVYIACPELEEFMEYTLVSELFNPRQGHLDLYEIEESDRWLLKTRFVPMDDDYGELKKQWLMTLKLNEGAEKYPIYHEAPSH